MVALKLLLKAAAKPDYNFNLFFKMSKQGKSNNNTNNNASETIERLVSINRVSKTVKGGKNMSFSALVIVGDKNGRVGFGKGNATEVSDAKNKAFEAAKKAMTKISLKEGRTIHHDVFGRFCAGKVYLRSAPAGTGVIAGGAVRAVLESVGVHDVLSKSQGSSNPHNVVKATFDALLQMRSAATVAKQRGVSLEKVFKG
mgnify:CR=1 FL=1